MSLTSGARLGPYEVLSPVGAGGMGEVYRARDTRLDRTVAVKVLPPHLADSAEFRQRFEREARAVSQLSHPYICALYDIGREGDVDYLVMEYLEGETLAERLGRGGALPLEQTLRYSVEIAHALDAAHRQGIVHRDLKPANVMLTRSGVKLLDFGLARVTEKGSAEGLTSVATQANVTEAGAVLGTFQYMSPEQLEGRDADTRSDIFALGTVLYEMATGAKAFQGSGRASLISAILRDEPRPLAELLPAAPAALERCIRSCLAKNPDDRWQSARDLASELAWIGQSGVRSGEARAAAPAPSGRRRAVLPWIFGGLGTVLAVAVVLVSRRAPERPPLLHATVLAPPGAHFDLLSGPPALSPDGTRIAFAGRTDDGKTSLYLRALDSDIAQALPGTNEASYPFWSPDGKFIGYSTGNSLWIVPAGGGVPEKILDGLRFRTATWNASGVILLARGSHLPLSRCSLSDRVLRPATKLLPEEIAHQAPQFLPDGRRFLYTSRRLDPSSRKTTGEIRLGALDSDQTQPLMHSESSAVYAPPGFVLYLHGTDLLARPFDAKRLAFTGEAAIVARRVASFDDKIAGLYSASDTGVLSWAEGDAVGLSQLAVYDLEGRRTATLGEAGDVWTPRLSHDGRRVAAEVMDAASGNRDIWIYDLARPSLPVRFTFTPGDMATPVWSPDDTQVAYLSHPAAAPTGPAPEWEVRVKSARGEGTETTVYSAPRTSYLTSWSPDGRHLAFNRPDPKTHNDVGVVSIAERAARVIVPGPAEDRDAVFSPDGRFLAYMSGESGRFEIYVQAFPGPGGKWQVSSAGGLQPRWSKDGRALFYVTLDGRFVMVPVRTSPTFEAEEPRPLFLPHMRRTLIAQYDVFPDGRRLLVNAFAAADTADSIHLVQNWTQLARPGRAPEGGR